MEILFLSRTNLLTLLNKLDRKDNGEDTSCSIIKYRNEDDGVVNSMGVCIIKAVEDEVMYVNRERGLMNPVDERYLKLFRENRMKMEEKE